MKVSAYILFYSMIAFAFCDPVQSTICKISPTAPSPQVPENQLFGNWQEFKRTENKRGGKEMAIEFSDTVKLEFRSDSTVYRYYPSGKTSDVPFHVTKQNKFSMGDDIGYNKIILTKDYLLLAGDDYNSYLRRVDKFYLAPIEKIIPGVGERKINILDALFLQGSWSLYKKEDPNFSRQKVYLHSLEIGKSHADGSYDVLAAYNDAGKTISDKGILRIEDDKFILQVMNQTKEYAIFKAVDNELVLTDGDITYFLKNLSK